MEHAQGERIPLTIADFDRERGTITLVIQAVGKTTREMQQSCQVGTRLHAVVGPMGIPSHIGQAKKVVCVGGGSAWRRSIRRPAPTRRAAPT
jgi:NAD(P)H-flavin reductase